MSVNKLELQVQEEYKTLVSHLIANQLSVSVMESMTGGMVASCITDVEGASGIFRGSFVTYSNEGKVRYGVPESIISTYGVYSKETAAAMAKACMDAYQSDIGIGITGTAGNVDPANPEGVPGEVYICIRFKTDEDSIVLRSLTANDRRTMKLLVAENIARHINHRYFF